MKKLDIIGVLIYTGLAGTVLFIVVLLLWAILRSLILGA